jgi:hypothetical protein
MTLVSGTLDALRALDHALDAPRGKGVTLGNWRWSVRQRMGVVRERLVAESLGTDGHAVVLASRSGAVHRERGDLLARLGALSPAVLEVHDAESVRRDVKRLVVDIAHHLQRLEESSAREHGQPQGAGS